MPLLAPWAVLALVPRAELAQVLACWTLGLVPGVLWTDRLLPPGRSVVAGARRLALGTALALVVFGLPATIACRLHVSLDAFVALYAASWLVALGTAWRRPARAGEPEAAAPVEPRWSCPASVAILLAAGVALAAIALGASRTGGIDRDLLWSAAGVALATAVVLRARSRSTPASDGAAERATGKGAAVAWIASLALAGFLVRVAYTAPEVPLDHVTHVARSVDFLAGGPLDRFEPSLAEDLPLDPEFTGPTTALLVATIARATGLECAAVAHTFLPPVIVWIGIAALIALFGTLFRDDRELVPIALASALAVLAHTGDTHRSLAAFVAQRALLPKATHLALVMPLQLATLVELARPLRPGRRELALAVLVALAGHLVHPWATVLGALWWSAAIGYAALRARGALRGLAALGLAIAALGAWQRLAAELAPASDVGSTPTIPLELELTDGEARRLDVEATLGEDRLLQLGVLLLPWLWLGAGAAPELGLVLACAALALLAAYWTPLFQLQALAVPRSLLWRTRWAVPSLAIAGVFGAVLARAAGGLARGRARELALALGALALPATLFVWGSGARFPAGFEDGELALDTKLRPAAHALAEHFGDRRATLLAPIPPAAFVATELCQLVPHVRTLVTTAHVVRWYRGADEFQRRAALIEAFYQGRAGATELGLLIDRYGVDHALVDRAYGRTARQRGALRELGWSRVLETERFELWRRP